MLQDLGPGLLPSPTGARLGPPHPSRDFLTTRHAFQPAGLILLASTGSLSLPPENSLPGSPGGLPGSDLTDLPVSPTGRPALHGRSPPVGRLSDDRSTEARSCPRYPLRPPAVAVPGTVARHRPISLASTRPRSLRPALGPARWRSRTARCNEPGWHSCFTSGQICAARRQRDAWDSRRTGSGSGGGAGRPKASRSRTRPGRAVVPLSRTGSGRW